MATYNFQMYNYTDYGYAGGHIYGTFTITGTGMVWSEYSEDRFIGDYTSSSTSYFTVTAIPNSSSFEFVGFYDGSTLTKLNFENPSTNVYRIPKTQNWYMRAVWKKVKYNVSASVNPSFAGTVTPASSTVLIGSILNLTANATDAKYRFSGWSNTLPNYGVSGTLSTDKKTLTGSLTMPAQDISVQAVLQKYIYTITPSVSDTNAGTITPSIATDFNIDNTITITATANTYFTFKSWTSSNLNIINSVISPDKKTATATISAISDCSIVAVFDHMPVPVKLIAKYYDGNSELDNIPTDANLQIGFVSNNLISAVNLSDPLLNPVSAQYGYNIPIYISYKNINDSPDRSINNAYEIYRWSGTKNDTSYTANKTSSGVQMHTAQDLPAEGYLTVTVVIVKKANPTMATLTVTSGTGGTVIKNPSYNDSNYIRLPNPDVVTLTPKPATYYVFNYWEYNNSPNIVPSGNNLIVTMNASPISINAVFREATPEERASETVQSYYCPSTSVASNIINHVYENDSGSTQTLHFRVNFYNNAEKENIISSSFSLLNQKRWFIKTESSITEIPLDGTIIESLDTKNIQFIPDVLPSEYSEYQYKNIIDQYGITEKPLLCGVQYFYELESYDENDVFVNLSGLQSITIKCSNVNLNSWRDNQDKNNWLCSGQGKYDLLVSGSGSQSIHPSIASNAYGQFIIAWQSRRETLNPIYTAIWDSENDILYGSGQGLQEHKALKTGNFPKVLIDHAQNPYISAHSNNTSTPSEDKITANKCPYPTRYPYVPATSQFNDFCYPGYAVTNDSLRDAVIRVYDADTTGSFVINENNIASVIEKQNIRLEIAGISGAYAVHLRNSTDQEWGNWINIGNQILDPETMTKPEMNVKNEAYFIDSDRFIVPFSVPRINGIRRICCQVLTFYGITETICLNVFVNLNLVEYSVEFFTDEGRTKPVPVYKGHPVLSGNLLSGSPAPIGTNITYYIKVTFTEPQINVSDSVPLKFNVTQQGTSGSYGNILSTDSSKTVFTGQFNIKRDDGLFNKDGIAFIDIIFPDDIVNIATSCQTDNSDKYNLMLMDTDISKYKNDFNTNAYQYYEKSRIAKTLNINEFAEYYNKDDIKNEFGNPNFFIKQD